MIEGATDRRALRKRSAGAGQVLLAAGALLTLTLSTLFAGEDAPAAANEKTVVATAPAALPAAFRKSSPASLDDLKAIEQHVTALAARVASAVVAVEVGAATGSGVVVSEDGLVLSAAHVCGAPHRDVRFVFPDGRTARGETLGTNHEFDAGMMRITSAGPWPYVPVGDLAPAKLGDWILALGHPGGFDPERSLVVRLGRLIRVGSDAVQTDCTLTGGDSGGPLVDMRGQLIGIHSRISESTTENFHVAVGAYRDSWDRLLKGESWGDDRPSPRSWVGARGTDDPQGCRLEAIIEGGPAAKAGVKPGDLVRAINGTPIDGYEAFRSRVAEANPGDELKFQIQRDGEDLSLNVTVEARRRRR